VKINKAELLSAVRAVAPALSSNKNQVEELSHIWFSGTHISAYDDVIGIQVEFTTEFRGGVRGDKLLGILETTGAETITVEEGPDKNLLMKGGGAIIKLALRPIEEWFWTPKVPEGTGFGIGEELCAAIDLVLLSASSDKVTEAEQRGITVIRSGTDADLYTTDSNTISWKPMAGAADLIGSRNRLIMPTQFCEQVKARHQKESTIIFDENSVYCVGTIALTATLNAGMLLFGRLVEDDEKADFHSMVRGYVGNDPGFPVPERLVSAIDRALVLVDKAAPIEVEVKDGEKLYLFAETPEGQIDDAIRLEGAEGQQDLVVRVPTGLLKRGLEGRERLRLTRDCLVLAGPKDFIHIIATK